MRHRSVRTRIGSILLTGAMLLSLLPTAAFATDGGAEGPIGDTVQTEPGDPSTGTEPGSGETPTTPSGEGNTSGNPSPITPVDDVDDGTELTERGNTQPSDASSDENVSFTIDTQKGYDGVELPAAPEVDGDTFIVTPENAQYTLDGAYGDINNKTIIFTDGNYGDLVLGRATKYPGSDTQYYIGGISEENELDFEEYVAQKTSGSWTASAYYVRNMYNVTLQADESADVVIESVSATGGHVYGETYDYVLEIGRESGSAYYLAQNWRNITFVGLNFTGQVNITSSQAETEIYGVRFENCSFTTGGTASANGACIRYYSEASLGTMGDLEVNSCEFLNCYQGVYTMHIRGVEVTNSTFDTTGHNAIAVQTQNAETAVQDNYIVITGNDFSNVGDRIIRFGYIGEESQIDIWENTATNSGDVDGEVIKAENLDSGILYNIHDNDWGENSSSANPELSDQEPVAEINGKPYYSLQDAVENADEGDTILITRDFVWPFEAQSCHVLDVDGLTLDLGGNTITAANFSLVFQGDHFTIRNGRMIAENASSETQSYALFIGDERTTSDVLIDGITTTGGINIYNTHNVIIRDVDVTGTGYYAVWCDENGQATIESGEFDTLANYVLGLTDTDSAINIAGGTFEYSTESGKGLVLPSAGNNTYGVPTISGGTFSGDVSEYCVDGLVSTDEDQDGKYTITTDTSKFQSGNGTENSPFVIMTSDQLKNFSASVNNGATYEGQYIQLGNDIQLIENWSPMGTFSGTFDGQNHSVTGLNITNGTGYTGFFSQLSGATVRKLKIEDATITCGADCWVGVIAGRADNSTIENCTVSGTITANNVGTSQSGNHGVAAAGVVEYAYQSTISNTTSAVNITVSTTDEIAYAGGIACEANGTAITGCTNTGSLSASSSTGYSYVGGIAAYMKNSSSITACVNNGTVESGGSSAAYATAGGIVGGIWSEQGGNSDIIRNSTNTGAVTATVGGSNTDCYAGGIAGEAYQYYADENTWNPDARSDVSITNCTNSGTVTVSPANENHVGGVLAWGDVEWKMELSGNNPGSYQESGWFSAPAEFTIDGNGGDLGYDANKSWLHVFETLTLKDVTISDDITVVEGQTVILDGTTILSNGVHITVEPGGTLINNTEDENIDVTGAAASIGNTYYSTLQAAVDAVGNNQTIVLLSDNAEIVTVGRTVTFELDQNGKDFTGEIRPGTNTTITTSVVGDITTYTCVYRTSTGGSSSGGSTRYNVSVEDTDNGSVRVSPSRASRGQTVTITVDPDEGYVLDRLIVRDSDGDRIDVEQKSSTRYTFEMPRGAVTIEATFVEGEEENVLPFRDVDVDDWFYDAVVYAYENDLMSGVSAREFAPNSTLTRAMVAQMLWAMEGKPQVNYLMQYADVGSGDWYAEAVRWASSQGIMSGYGDSQFGPNDPVTRQQLALILYNYAKEKDYDTTGGGMALREYSDYDAIADWAVTGLGWAVEHGLISGMGDGVLAPTGGATRAQVAQIFMNFCEDVAE